MPVELHCHTTASDGTLTPAELVGMAVRKGLEALAITDHDTTAAYAPAVQAARGFRLEIIPALEINAERGGLDVHVLGYFLDPSSEPLQRALARLRESRLQRARLMAERLGELGVPVRYERVLEIARGDSVGRPHVARAMVEAGHVPDMAAAFDRFLAVGKPGYVPRRNLSPEDAIQLIREASGVPVLAHPGLIGDDSIVPDLVRAGLGGIEAHYPQHPLPLRQHYVDLAARHGLLVTGGSDYHGPESRHRVDLGAVPLPPDTVGRLREAAGRVA